MNRQSTAVLDHDDADAAPADLYHPDTYSGRLGDQLADRQTPVPKRVLRRVTPAEEIYDDTGDGSFLRAQTRIRVRRGVVPQSMWGKVLAGFALLITLGAMIAGVMVVRNFLLHDSRFVIGSSSDIQIVGNSHVSRPQLLSIFGEDIGRNLFRVPLSQRRSELETLPWVEHATVMRLLPDRLRVSVVERTPVAFVRQGTGIGLVDAYGVLLDMPEDDTHGAKYSFPVLTGIVATDPLSTRAARMKLYQQFIHDVDSSGSKVSDTLSEVDVSDPEDVKALIPNQSSEILVHFGDQDFLTRYQRYEQQLPAWRTQYPNLASVDMRYQNQAVLDMTHKTAGDAPSAGGAADSAMEPAPASAPAAAPVVTPAAVPAVAPPASHAAGKKSVATLVKKAAPKPAARPATVKRPVAPVLNAGKATVPAAKPTATPLVTAAKTPAAASAGSKAQSKAPAAQAATAPAFSMQHPLTRAYAVPVKTVAAKPKSAIKPKPGAKVHAAVVKSKKTAKTA